MYIHFSTDTVKIINPFHIVLSFYSLVYHCLHVPSLHDLMFSVPSAVPNSLKEVTELLSDELKSVLPTQIALLTSDFWHSNCVWFIARGENRFQEDCSVLCCASDGKTTLYILCPLACSDVQLILKEWLFGRASVS
jgi:hypothetical protein